MCYFPCTYTECQQYLIYLHKYAYIIKINLRLTGFGLIRHKLEYNNVESAKCFPLLLFLNTLYSNKHEN